MRKLRGIVAFSNVFTPGKRLDNVQGQKGMRSGRIYILINQTLKGLVKIGKTDRSSEERAAELSTTGVPTPFFVAYEHPVCDCDTAERVIHERLQRHRVTKGREFFELPVKDAIKHVATICCEFPEELAGDGHIEASSARKEAWAEYLRRNQNAHAVRLANALPPRNPEFRNPGFRSTEYVHVRCSNCSTEYSVTMTRYELRAACPKCSGYQHVVIAW